MLKCSVCTKVFRHTCVNISANELELINDEEKGCDWSCINCRQIGNQIKDLKSLILSLQAEIQALKMITRF